MYSVPVCATNIMMVSTNNNTTLKSIVERVYLSNGVIMGKMGKRKWEKWEREKQYFSLETNLSQISFW